MSASADICRYRYLDDKEVLRSGKDYSTLYSLNFVISYISVVIRISFAWARRLYCFLAIKLFFFSRKAFYCKIFNKIFLMNEVICISLISFGVYCCFDEPARAIQNTKKK